MVIKNNLYNFFYLALLDIKIRYRNTFLGPFWSTLSLGITLVILGFIWTKVFSINHYEYIPNLYLSYIFWVWISDTLTDSITVFNENKDIVHNYNIPIFFLNFKIIIRNFFIFLHNFPLIFAIFYIYKIELGINIFFSIFLFVHLPA